MTSLLTVNHYIDEVNNFINRVESTNTSYYIYTARPYPWANSSGGNDDSAIQVVNTSVTQIELDLYNELSYGKLIAPADINHVAPRYNWVSNTVYAQYDQNDSALYGKNFYVVTSDSGEQYNVYKCIDNAGGAPSLVKPTLQTTYGTFETGDGYTWKYMYTIDPTANTKFTSTNFIPVTPNTQVQGNATIGTIDVIRISNGGTGYSVYETGTIAAIVDTLNIKLPNTSSSVDGHYVKSSVYLKSGFGAGQVREIVGYDGTTKNATISEPIETFIRLDFSNNTLITGGEVGETVRQEIDTLNYTLGVGYFSAGANVVQSGTGVAGTVLTANNTALKVSKFDKDQDFTAGLAIRDLSDTGSLKTDKVNISNNSGIGLSIIVTSGSGYTANANVSIASSSGNGAVAVAQSNSTGKIETIVISNTGSGYLSEPTVEITQPTAQTFNSNTDVTGGTGEGSNNVISLATANVYVVGDQIRYTVSAGNTAISGLQNNTVYYIQFSNSTVIALSNSANTSAGNRIALTKGVTESGHTIQGTRATARLFPTSMYAVNTSAGAILGTEYSNGDFIRVGENANTNIRRIESVNSTVVIVDRPFSSTITSANTYKLTIAMIPDTIQTDIANGVISNTNLNTTRLTISNTSVIGGSYILGERVELVTESNTSLNANGIVAFTNTSTIFISGINGTWYSGPKVRGSSSGLVSDVVSVTSSPNITLKNPTGTFMLGQLVDFRSSTGSNTGIANVISVTNLTENSIDYQIGPTVKITGDGNGAIAVAVVNTAVGLSNAISSIQVVNTGSAYTQANISVYSNTLYGSGASVLPVISPLEGHGANPVTELGARYAGISVKFDTTSNENWYLPSNIQFRKVGILKDPSFANVTIQTQNYTNINLTLANTSGSWVNNEVVLQSTTNATGIVITGNTTLLKLKDVKGTFASSNTIAGLTSGATANVSATSNVTFTANEMVEQESTGAKAIVVSALSNSTIYLANVTGQMANGATLRGATSNAVATVSSIKSPDDTKDLTTTFADRFNQTSRITLGSNTGAFTQFETITQANTSASAIVVNTTYDIDLQVNAVSGTFTVGDNIINSNTSANAKCIFANSTYIKLTAVSNTSLFTSNNEINNGLGSTAIIQNIYSVITVTDVTKVAKFVPNAGDITGNQSGSVATVNLVQNPDLFRESGKVMYVQTLDNVITRTLNTTEEIRLVIKF